jgi:thiamine-phosphate pyrophosphorylase
MLVMTTFDQRLQRLARARLYAIVDTGYVEPDRVPFVTEHLVLGGVDLIQLRAKKLPLAAILELGKKMRVVIPSDGPLFILNDHPELVAEIGADGIHVGQDDLSVDEARTRAGAETLVGKSTHSLNQALAAEKEGADYIGVGPIYATPTKPDYVPVGPALIGQVSSAVRVPQFCIGGINEQTLPEVLAAGARRVVIVSALLQSEDIPAYCQRVREQLRLHEKKKLIRNSLIGLFLLFLTSLYYFDNGKYSFFLAIISIVIACFLLSKLK